MSDKKIRVRFAPSPTGPLHIGGVRTALYNYLFAKKMGGKMILRIEDTDQNRFVDGAEKYIIDAFNWCGIKFDEGIVEGGQFGPYRQSERKEKYKQFALDLVNSGHAYFAFDTTTELNDIRNKLEAEKKTFVYNSITRKELKNSLNLNKSHVERLLSEHAPYVIRFKMPEQRDILLNDLIRGQIKINTEVLDDKILFKSDGMPTYHLANIIDDHLMEISHVIRGEEWLPSLPLHFLLYEAFGWETPEFAHLPLLLKPEGSGKLSKRDGDRLGFPVFPIEWKDQKSGEISKGYREEGYFQDAFINMLALLGWNPGTEQEIFRMRELIDIFSIDRVGKSGSKFDPEKAKWFNHQYLIRKDDEFLANQFIPILASKGINGFDEQYVKQVVNLVKERCSFVNEFWDQSEFFFIAPASFDQKAVKKRWKIDSYDNMLKLRKVLDEIVDFSSENTESLVKQWIEDNEYEMGSIMNAFRLLVVGALKGPHLFDIIAMIGKKETLNRIDHGLKIIGKKEA